jgi:hypothetical protein
VAKSAPWLRAEGARDGPLSSGAPGRRRRLKWSAVLQALPPQFTTKDVAQTAKKPIAQVYTHVSGWMKAKKVRKVSDGYQKMSGVS